MKLQINSNGAWRNVLDYVQEYDVAVRVHAANLAALSGDKLRVLHDDGKPAAYWKRETGWEEWTR
jgi:chromosome condensin MukBEF ATPase and DNA-binding subunit MukB